MDEKTPRAIAVSAAALAAAAPAGATTYTATLVSFGLYNNSALNSFNGNISSSTATWSYDDVTNLVTQTGGTFNVRFTTAPTQTLFRYVTTGLVAGNGGAAGASSFACVEGNFGGGVGASICGNYNFGANFTNNTTTTWGPGTSVSRTLGGDDGSIGAQQSIATLDTMNTTSFDSTPVTGTLVITNKTCTGPCATLPVGANNGGQQWTLGNFVLVVQGPVDDAADAESGQQISIDVMANDAGYADPVTVTIDTPPNQGGTATVTNSPGAASAIRINYTSAPNFSGTETSLVPRMAASRGAMPSSSKACTRSPTTVASSTMMPSTSRKPISDSELIVRPAAGNIASAPSIATGIPTLTHSAMRRRRNSASTTTTSTRPLQALPSSASRRSTRSCDSSREMSIAMPSGSCARLRPR